MRHDAGRGASTVLLWLIMLAGCSDGSSAPPPNHNPEQGAILLSAHGCGGCHIIPGVVGADGTIGPPLDQFANRAYIAGKLPNRFDNLKRWIQDPHAIEPGTAMPDLPVNPAEADAMARYLYTIQ